MPHRPVPASLERCQGGGLPVEGALAPGGPSNIKDVDLPLPHERDQALGQVATTPDPVMRQAKRDLDAGQVDTDMRATPGLDAKRRKDLVPTPDPQTASSPTRKSGFIKPSHPMPVWTERFAARLLALQPSMAAVTAAQHAALTFPDAADLEPETAAEIFAAEEPPGEAVILAPHGEPQRR